MTSIRVKSLDLAGLNIYIVCFTVCIQWHDPVNRNIKQFTHYMKNVLNSPLRTEYIIFLQSDTCQLNVSHFRFVNQLFQITLILSIPFCQKYIL
jgi:hypothetical protein